MLVEPDLAEFATDVAVIVAVPGTDGVNNPDEDIDPSVADQVTCELRFPVSATVAEH
jgi:hypothetical protein